MARTIERQGKTTGRWPNYTLVVDGVSLGTVKRVVQRGHDAMLGRRQQAWDGWAIKGTVVDTQQEAESRLIERGVTFGYLKNV